MALESPLLRGDKCKDYWKYRTQEVFFINETPWAMELWLYQCIAGSGAPNDDFITDTGVVVGAANQAGNQRYIGDPCYAGGGRGPIQATLIKGSFKLKGAAQHVNCPDSNASTGKYFRAAGWRLSAPDSAYRGNGMPDVASLVIEPLEPFGVIGEVGNKRKG